MSGHNPPHGRLGQPNTSWNPLQVPSYVPRQPQLAHMSSERPIARQSPLTWHTPPTHQDKMYRCTTGNLMNNLEMNPLLQGYGRNVGMPLGSVDLSLSSASRSTPSPKATHSSNVHSAAALAPQSSQSSCSSLSTLPSNIPSPGVYNMAGDSGHHNTNHQPRTSAATNASGGVIQSTTTVAALKERMQGTSYMGSGGGNASNCFGGNANSIVDSSISGGNGFGADLSNRAANDPTTLVTGGLLIKDAKQINSEMEGKNGRDCFSHLPDSAELVKEFIMQSMQNSNALSVSPKRSSPTRSLLQTIPSPARSRSPPLNLLLGSVPMDGKLGADCLNSINLTMASSSTPANSATESTDSGNSSGAALSMASVQSECAGRPAGLSSLPSTNPAASPNNNSITSSEDSIDSMNGRTTSTRRRRKPERTSKMNAHLGGDGGNAFFPLGKGINAAAIGDLEPLRPGSVVRGDISALAIEGINALSHGIASNDGLSSCSSRMNSAPNRSHGSVENHATPLNPTLVQQHLLDNLIQSNTGSSRTSAKVAPSINTSSSTLDTVAMGGNGVVAAGAAANDINAFTNPTTSTDSARGLSSFVSREAVDKDQPAKDASDRGAVEKSSAMIDLGDKRDETFAIRNGTTVVDLVTPEQNCNGPPQLKSGHEGEKSAYKSAAKANASDSSYEEVENKLEEMFAGIEEQPDKRTDSDAPDGPGTGRDNGCHELDAAVQLNASSQELAPTLTDGDVLKQLSSDGIVEDALKLASVIDATAEPSGGPKSGKKPLTPAQKRGNGAKSVGAGEIVTSTPAKRKRAPKRKSNAPPGTHCPFPSPESPGMAGLLALATKNKKEKRKGTPSTSAGGERTGRSDASGVGKKKGKVGKKAKGGTKNNEAASSSSGGLSNAPSIETNGKYKGPYVQVKVDGSHTVINTPISEEDGERAQNKTKKFGSSLNSSEHSKIRGLHVSTLSTKYDADTTDTSWMCVFCKTGPHKFRLGDLFGPYIISTTSSEYRQSQVDMDFFSAKRTRDALESQRAKQLREQQQQLPELGGPKGKKRKNATGSGTASVVPSPGPSGSKMVVPLKQERIVDDHSQQTSADMMYYGMMKAGDNSYEVWTHEDCLVWAPGVYMVGTRIVGLEAAIWNCCRHQCQLCTHYGAVVSCLRQGCSSKAHFICARKQNWKMTHDFQSFCALHADRPEEPPGAQPATSGAPAHAHTAKQPRKEFKPNKDAAHLPSRVS